MGSSPALAGNLLAVYRRMGLARGWSFDNFQLVDSLQDWERLVDEVVNRQADDEIDLDPATDLPRGHGTSGSQTSFLGIVKLAQCGQLACYRRRRGASGRGAIIISSDVDDAGCFRVVGRSFAANLC